MGAGASANKDENSLADASKRNKQINQFLQNDKIMEARTVKLLLLGAAESGKSTFAKQMKIIHEAGFSESERASYVQLIYSNIMQTMAEILSAMTRLDIPFEHVDREADRKLIIPYTELVDKSDIIIDMEIGMAISRLWKDGGVQKCYARSREFQLNDSADYYFNSIDRISRKNYIPNEQDILRTRLKTTGIIETSFKFKGYVFRMFDVGGQRSERRKWIHCFDNVTAIIFTAALSAYDQLLREDDTTNRMHESLNLFSSVCNHHYFRTTSIILFLNKKDIFEKKIGKSSLTNCFPEYKGNNTYTEAAEYIRKKFDAAKCGRKEIYTHFTVATDTRNINFVFDASMAVVLRNNLEEAGMF